MRKPELDVYEASTRLAWALDDKDWQEVQIVFQLLLDHKKALQTYKTSKKGGKKQ